MTDNNSKLIAEAIDGAEEVQDVLDGLAEEVSVDPGAPLKADVLRRLRELKREDPSAFEDLRAQLKQAGCRVTALDTAMKDGQKAGNQPQRISLSTWPQP